MPASEQTWRDSKVLHVVFGVTSLCMLGTTIWMLTADHTREWKQNQRTFREIETWTTAARMRQANNEEYESKRSKLAAALVHARQQAPPEGLVKSFRQELVADAERQTRTQGTKVEPPSFERAQETYERLREAKPADRPPWRDRFITILNGFVSGAKFRENNVSTRKKFRAADLDVARSQYDIAVGEGQSPELLSELQETINTIKAAVEKLTLEVQDATTHRKTLEGLVAQMTAAEAQARKELEDHELTLTRLADAREERRLSFLEQLIALPIIDAFGGPLRPEQIWLPKLTINNNFRDVARFDRCITCHQAMDRTAPGTATDPGYRPQQMLTLELATPAEPPAEIKKVTDRGELLRKIYGFALADEGLLDDDDVTVDVVRPVTPATKARVVETIVAPEDELRAEPGLMLGDVIIQVKDVVVLSNDQVYTNLLDNIRWGEPIPIRVRRGLPHPYVSHPRLDLFAGSLSPHKMGDVGCTVCHEGQGSATAFKWASHTPNNPRQAAEWSRDHGWFNNHHWIFPMNPKRFVESSCLKCHHEVTELEPSEKFPDPPAPTLMAGYNLIKDYGCFGCHEINGYDGPSRRIGPDMRTEPNYSAVAQAMVATGGLSDEQRTLAELIAASPEQTAARHQLAESLRAAKPEEGDAGAKDGEDASAEQSQQLAALERFVGMLDDVEAPGKLRKVGPSLRRVASKLDYDFLFSWIRRPQDFRPSTKMPQFFGLDDHLEGSSLKDSKRFEPIEIRGLTQYLLSKSQPFDDASGAAADGSAERGKKLFQTRGCLACHKHSDFPEAKMEQGPDLSRIGAKLGQEENANGPKWLVAWLRDPSRYHPRTLMPNVLLEQMPGPKGTDPVRDIAAYLLASRGVAQSPADAPEKGETNAAAGEWRPTDVPPQNEMDSDERKALRELALLHLRDKFPLKQAQSFLDSGIPEDRRNELKGDEIELLGPMSEEKQLLYVGRRTISKFGCYGCHDIPGFEDAKPIGTGLADWGRKGTDKLAFEQIGAYITRGHGHAGADHADSGTGTPHDSADHRTAEHSNAEHSIDGHNGSPAGDGTASQQSSQAGGHDMNFVDMDPDQGFFLSSLMEHGREGFIWQKLREPRSYDYKKTQNKGYNERLRMPQFTAFGDKQRQAIITFVLGLVAEPPASQFVYRADPQRQAIVEGRRIIEKYNCGGCHAFKFDQWKLAYEPEDFEEPAEVNDYAFLMPKLPQSQIQKSLETDVRGRRHATVTGMPVVNPETGKPQKFDEDEAPIAEDDTESKPFYRLILWDNQVVNGQPRHAGVHSLFVPADRIQQHYEPDGGYLARLLFPVVVADERAQNPNVKPEEAWGWLPPPLVREGVKVQSDWLHDFLLDPHPIRPATVLRMPKFNMSSDEAGKLAAYFATVDKAEYPYDFDNRTRSGYLARADERHPGRLGDALKIVTDNNYCIKCHLVGDFTPTGSDRAKAPRLDQVYKRMRAEYLLPWLANPKRLLPYTGMPQNIPPGQPVSQKLYKGTSEEQLNGVVDLLLNYDRYMESRTSIKPLVSGGAPPSASTGAAEQTRDAGGRSPTE